MRVSKFLIPYSFSILSFFISATALDLYDRMGNNSELVSPNIIGKIIQSTAQMGVLTLYFGVPIILGGCLLGELLFRGIIFFFVTRSLTLNDFYLHSTITERLA